MTPDGDKNPYVSMPIKEFVDREIAALKETVYIELDARAKALELSHKDNMRHMTLVIAVVAIGVTVLEIGVVLLVHFWR